MYKLLKKGEDRKGRSSSIRKNTSGSHFKYNTSKPGTSSTELAELAGDMEGKGSQLAWKDVEVGTIRDTRKDYKASLSRSDDQMW